MAECLPEIGLAMYTVHQAAKRELSGTFAALAQMGYRGVELYGGTADFGKEAMRRALRESGLTLYGWHVEWREMQEDRLEQTLADLEELRCPIAVVPCLGGRWHIGHGPQEECLEVWQRRIEQMNKLAERLERCGIRMAYHNHDHEFRLSYQGKTVFRWLFDGLASGVLMELDTGNCLEGGGDPCRELARCASRDVLLHMKPYGPAHGFDVTLGAPDDANDWFAILRALGNRPGRLLVESEAVCLPEMENARLCLEGARSVLKRCSKE